MMTWVVALAMLALAVGFICYRFWRPEKTSANTEYSARETNKSLYRQTVADLERQYPSGNEPEKLALLIEAQRQLLSDDQHTQNKPDQEEPGQEHPGNTAADKKRGGGLLLGVSLAVVLLAVVLYAHLGALPDVQIRSLLESSDEHNHLALRDALVKRLAQRDGNSYYWLLLARLELGENPAQAVEAYRRARQLEPDNGAISAELAQALFVASENRLDIEIESLVIEALNADPDNTTALELAGIVAFSQRDYASAVTFWQRSLSFMAPGSANAQALRVGVSKAQSLLRSAGLESGSGDADGQTSVPLPVLLSVDVSLDTALLKQLDTLGELSKGQAINPDSTVFVYVRQWQGPPMPLVAQRYVVENLPLTVSFSDAMSLSPARKLSSVAELEIIVRISSSGSLQASPGDFEGRLGPITLDKEATEAQRHFTLAIDQRL